MRPAHRTALAPRTAPDTARRLAATVTALLAVLLTLAPAGPAAGGALAVGLAVPGPLTAPTATTPPHPDPGFHADDGCATPCAAQARARHDHLGERPAPPDRPAAARAAGPVPAVLGRTPAAPGAVLVSPGRTSHDHGRAPPAPSGT